MISTRRLGMLVLVTVLAGCSEPTSVPALSPSGETSTVEPSEPGTFRISGRVADYRTGRAVTNALVHFGQQAVTTTTSGTYAVMTRAGDYGVSVDGSPGVATIAARGVWTRGDVYLNVTGCSGRYGAITERFSGLPVAGATVTMGFARATTDADGWYRLEYFCDTDCGTCNTVLLTVTASGYGDYTTVAGRGGGGVFRQDIQLNRQ